MPKTERRPTTKAVILAAGMGTRMRRAAESATLDASQQRAADAGLKGMIPVGRPFLDYAISALADAGIADVCLVIGASPEHQRVRDHYGSIRAERVRLHFAVQHKPLGSANALLAAESFANGEVVLSVNSDNYYPVPTLRALRELGAAGLSVFERDTLLRMSNIPEERARQWAVVKIDRDGTLEQIVERPDAATLARLGDPVYISMNSWSLPPEIYEACRRVTPSSRGELELPRAVQFARDRLGARFQVLVHREGVLDLSTRMDIESVTERLRDVTVSL